MNSRRTAARAAAWGALACTAACAHAPAGHANFTVASHKLYGPTEVEVVGHIDDQRCVQSALFVFAWGDMPDHEYLIAKALRDHHADAITNARVTFETLPLLVYTRQCAHVTGDLIRFKPGQPALAANGGTP